MSAHCLACGAIWTADETCRGRFEACLALEYEHPSAFGAVHHLAVLCYMLQHNEYSRESWLEARQMLFDFMHNDILPADQWATWLTVTTAESGLQWAVAGTAVTSYLQQQVAALGEARYVNEEEAHQSIQQLVLGQLGGGVEAAVPLRIYHRDRQHTVQAGETFSSIARDYGLPYPWLQQANAGVDALFVGQVLNVPSADVFLPLPVVPHKRIVISIPQQRMWAYENGDLVWEWDISTGISTSPTSPGVYQVQTHEPTAYAGNWDLWMPYFMGIYHPVPGNDFMNGFHGFPTRNGSQLLWTNSLGTPVTYGCILVGDGQIELLYNWAEAGVVVEIQ